MSAALRSTFNLVRAMLPIPWAWVEIGKPVNQYGAYVSVEGSKLFKLRKIGAGWTVTSTSGGKVEFYETRDDAIAAILAQVWDV